MQLLLPWPRVEEGLQLVQAQGFNSFIKGILSTKGTLPVMTGLPLPDERHEPTAAELIPPRNPSVKNPLTVTPSLERLVLPLGLVGYIKRMHPL